MALVLAGMTHQNGITELGVRFTIMVTENGLVSTNWSINCEFCPTRLVTIVVGIRL